MERHHWPDRPPNGRPGQLCPPTCPPGILAPRGSEKARGHGVSAGRIRIHQRMGLIGAARLMLVGRLALAQAGLGRITPKMAFAIARRQPTARRLW